MTEPERRRSFGRPRLSRNRPAADARTPSRSQAEPVPRRSRGRPKPEDAVAIEKRLLEIALQEFLRQGYGGASMTRIVHAARASKTTMYSRYSSKEELFRAIIAGQIDRLSPSASLESEGDPLPLAEGLKSYASHMLKLNLHDDLLGVNRLIYTESFRFPELGAALAERTELGIQRICDFIRERATADGVPCQEPRAVAETFIFMIRGWYVNAMLSNRPVSSADRERWVECAVRTLLAARADW